MSAMKIALAALAGLILGAIVGGLLGIVVGVTWTTLMHTTCFEGYCAMLAFFDLPLAGIAVGGPLGAIALGIWAGSVRRSTASGGDAGV
jgi:hypothetical protein